MGYTDWAVPVPNFSNCINLFIKSGTESVRDINLISGTALENRLRMVTLTCDRDYEQRFLVATAWGGTNAGTDCLPEHVGVRNGDAV